MASWRSRMKTAGSGSVLPKLGSEDPDPYQNVPDPPIHNTAQNLPQNIKKLKAYRYPKVTITLLYKVLLYYCNIIEYHGKYRIPNISKNLPALAWLDPLRRQLQRTRGGWSRGGRCPTAPPGPGSPRCGDGRWWARPGRGSGGGAAPCPPPSPAAAAPPSLLAATKLSFFQCCGSGSGIRCLFDPWSAIRNSFFFRIPDLESRTPNPYFDSLMTIFAEKSTIILSALYNFWSSEPWIRNDLKFWIRIPHWNYETNAEP